MTPGERADRHAHHAGVDENGEVTLVADVDHWIDHLLAEQVDFVLPLETFVVVSRRRRSLEQR